MRQSTVKEPPTDTSGQKGGNFALQERAFASLPKNSEASRRRAEVQKFRAAPGPNERARWNASVKDEAHPFPERAMTSTTTVYNGAETVATHFPETVRGTVDLRVPEAASGSDVWQRNLAKSKSSQHNAYQCAALDDPVPPLSYLAQKIVEDNAQEKRRRQQQWNASTTQTGFRGNRFTQPDAEPNYRQLNKDATTSMTQGRYVTPMQRSAQVSQDRERTKQLKRDVEGETDLTLHVRPDGPAVFKMSNVDQWWGMDPVRVAAEQTAKRQALNDNCYSTYSTSTRFPPSTGANLMNDTVDTEAESVPSNE